MHFMTKQYVFGYGSLICTRARPEITLHSDKTIPVRLSGYHRFWNGDSLSKYAVVAVEKRSDGTCNGILIEINESDLPALDARESCYERVSISQSELTPLGSDEVPQGDIWVYKSKRKVPIYSGSPLIQSYIDVILTGCLEYGHEFATEFLQTTSGWSESWLNDREQPKYSRALVGGEQTDLNDSTALLLALIPYASKIL